MNPSPLGIPETEADDAKAAPLSNARASSSAWSRGKWLLRLALGILILLVLLRHPESARVAPLLRQISPLAMLMAVLVYMAGQALSALRWQLLLNAARPVDVPPMPLPETLRIYFIGMFWNLWMPTSIGGDAMRSYLAGQRGYGLGVAATSVLLDRLVGLLALLCVCVVGLLLNVLQTKLLPNAVMSSNQAAQTQVAYLILVALSCITLGVLVLWWLLRAGRNSDTASDGQLSGWRHKLLSLQEVLRNYTQPARRKVLWLAFVLSLIVHVLQITINIGLARAVDLSVPIAMFWWVSPALALSSVLPLGIGGLGVREAAAVALLRLPGVEVGTVVAWSLLWQATVWSASSPGGLFSLGLSTRTKNSTKVL
jgi:uncharacterized protein (TIRG00374 family)